MHRSKGHMLLKDSEADEQDRVIAGRSFAVRYLGSAEITSGDGKGKGCTDGAISEIFSRYSSKAKFKSLTRLELFVSANCVSLNEPSHGALVFRYQTVKITFCNTSNEHQNAFSFVVRESLSSPFKAHVIYCDSPAEANEVCTTMSQAFAVRSALFHAKRVDKAGWSNGLLHLKNETDKRKVGRQEAKGESRWTESTTNGHADNNNNNNGFGDFKRAEAVSQWNGESVERQSNGVCHANNGWPGGDINLDRGCYCTNKENRNQNGAAFPIAKVLLSKGRSNSAPCNVDVQNPWAANAHNKQVNLTTKLLQATMNGATDDEDGFSILARERSSSMSIVRPVS